MRKEGIEGEKRAREIERDRHMANLRNSLRGDCDRRGGMSRVWLASERAW
jgi:hypothetical protein